MKIERLHIGGFGRFGPTELSFAPGLNLVLGPNEAGKSTLLTFIRAMLFGFERRDHPERYEPESGPFGGELQVRTAPGPFALRRTWGKKRVEGELALRGAHGEPVEPSRLADALGPVTRELYFEVFAFGLDALADFERLSKQGTVSDALFAAGMQGASRLPQARKALIDAAEAIYKPTGRAQQLHKLMLELEGVQQQLRSLGDLPARYVDRCARRDQLEKELAAIEQALAELRQETSRLSRLASAGEDLRKLREEEAALAELPDLARFPEDASARLEAKLAAAAAAAEEISSCQAEAARVARALADVEAPLPCEANELQARAALEAYRGREESLRKLGAGRAALSAKRERGRAQVRALGLSCDEAALRAMDCGSAARGELSTARDAIAAAENRLSERAAASSNARAERERRDEELQRLDAELAALPKDAPDAVRRRLAAAGRVAPLRDEAARLRRSREELEARTGAAKVEDPAPRSAFPAWMAALGIAFALAIAVLSALTGAGALRFAIAGAALAAGALVALAQRRAAQTFAQAAAAHAARAKQREEEADRVAAELRRACDDERAKAGELSRALSEAGPSGGEDAAALAVLCEELQAAARRCEQRVELSARRPSAEEKARDAAAAAEAASAAEAQAQGEVARLAGAVERWCTARALPAGLSAARASELAADIAQVQERLAELDQEESSFAAEEAGCAQAQANLEAQARAAKVEGRGSDVLAAGLSAALDAARERRARRAELSAKRAEIEVRSAQRSEANARSEAALRALLAECGCANEEELRTRHSQAIAWRALKAEVGRLRAGIEAGSGLAVAEAARQLSDAGGAGAAASRRAEAEAELAGLDAQRKSLSEEKGEIRRELESLEKDAQVASARVQEEALKLRIHALAEEYAVNRLASALLERATQVHERDHQPRLLKLASARFSALTRGRYLQVRAAEEHALNAIDAEGRPWDPAKLSRGTREQLYLALRLAVIEDFGQRNVRLPIVVDDVLVNFDPDRARSAIEVLAEVAREQQVLAFTCHPPIAELFLAQGANPVELAPGKPRIAAAG